MERFSFLNNVKYKVIEKPLSETEVETYETLNNIQFPDDYKSFLINIGNGICIVMPDGNERVVSGINNFKHAKHNPLLCQEFLFEDAFDCNSQRAADWFEDCINPYQEDDDNCLQCNHFNQCPFAFADKLNNKEFPYYRGAFYICYAGCTYQYFLILTGKHRGEVWIDNELTYFEPIKQNFVDFLEWVSTSEAY